MARTQESQNMSDVISIPAASVTIGGGEIHSLIAQAKQAVESVPAALDDTTASDAQDLLADLVKLKNMIDGQRVAAKAPYLDAGKKIDAAAKIYLAPLDDYALLVRAKLKTYQMDVDRKRLAAHAEIARLEAAARVDAEKTGRTASLAASAAVPVPVAVGVKTREFKVKKVVDIAKVPAKYLIVDWAAVDADMEAGMPLPPGLAIETEKRVVAR
jgi:hypothetical protein